MNKLILPFFTLLFLTTTVTAQKEGNTGLNVGSENTLCNPNLPNRDRLSATKVLCGQTVNIPMMGGAGDDGNEISMPHSTLKETHSAWFQLNIASDGVLDFEIVPLSYQDDFDFVLFRKDALGRPQLTRASTTGPSIGGATVDFCNGNHTGLQADDTDIFEGDFCITSNADQNSDKDGFTAVVNVLEGDVFWLCVNNYYTCNGFKIAFDRSTCTFPCTATKQIANTNNSNTNNVMIYPNPTNEAVNFTITLPTVITDKPVDVIVTDLLGRTVLSTSYPFSKGKNTVQLNTEKLQQGTYTIHTYIDEALYHGTFIKL